MPEKAQFLFQSSRAINVD